MKLCSRPQIVSLILSHFPSESNAGVTDGNASLVKEKSRKIAELMTLWPLVEIGCEENRDPSSGAHRITYSYTSLIHTLDTRNGYFKGESYAISESRRSFNLFVSASWPLVGGMWHKRGVAK